MCPLWPFHLIVIYMLALCPLWLVVKAVPKLTADFDPGKVLVNMNKYYDVNVTLKGLDTGFVIGDTVYIRSDNKHIADTEDFQYKLDKSDIDRGFWRTMLRIHGNFLGFTDIRAFAKSSSLANMINATGALDVTVIRPNRVIDTVFTSSVATFVSLIFINFGCAMHWPTVKGVLKRPIGPAIAIAGQFVLMPLISYGLGLLIFPNDPTMRLGMFFTGVSPGGGSSNIWTVILNGNLNLSIAMTTISTILSFAFMPAWLFSLGQVIFTEAKIVVPYSRIATFVIGLIIPLAIGFAMQKYTPKIATFMVRMLKCLSTILLLFIIIFAIVTNLYIFELFTWQIYVAGMAIPWLGYIAGYLVSRFLNQTHSDSIAISLDIGIQNTGIAIFLLRYALTQPAADLTTVVPVSVAIMSPVPMMFIYFVQKIKACISNQGTHKKIPEEESPISETPEQNKSIAILEADGYNYDTNKYSVN